MELLERTPFLTELDGLLHQAVAGQGRLILLGGEAGIGKTVLVQHFCESAAGTAQVLVGARDPLSAPRPLGPLLDIVAIIGGDIRDLFRAGTPRVQAFSAFLAELATPFANVMVPLIVKMRKVFG